MFKIGDHVVHPRCGVGQIVKLSVEQFVQGEKRPFYEVSFSDGTVWIPLGKTKLGIRELSKKSEIERCRRILMAPAVQLNADIKLREKELITHLKTGTLEARCEVVRDLSAFSWHKPLSGSISAILKVNQSVLCQEWAAVEGVTPDDADVEIESLLEKGRQVNDNE